MVERSDTTGSKVLRSQLTPAGVKSMSFPHSGGALRDRRLPAANLIRFRTTQQNPQCATSKVHLGGFKPHLRDCPRTASLMLTMYRPPVGP